MVSKIISSAVRGIDGYLVEVEVDLSQGMPGFDIVGVLLQHNSGGLQVSRV